MTFKKSAMAAASAVVGMALATVALAQTGPAKPPTGPAAPPITHGPALAGVCIYYFDASVGNSAVGKFVDTRLETIVKTVNAELQAEETAIQNEAKAIDAAAKAPGADETALKKRALDLENRINKFKQKAQLRQREVSVTEQKARLRIRQEVSPIIAQVYQQKQCSVLLSGEMIVLGNPAMDITAAVTAGLNAKIQQFAFDRERLDQAAPGQPPKPPGS